MWPADVKGRALSACGETLLHLLSVLWDQHGAPPHPARRRWWLFNVGELHLPLCFNCHAEVGHYNDRHPKGTKYRPGELRGHRDAWFLAMAGAERLKHAPRNQTPALPEEIHEGQRIQFKGYLSRQTFVGPPNYDNFRTDVLEIYWLLTLPEPFRFSYHSFEPTQAEPVVKPNVRVLHLMLKPEQYAAQEDKLNGDAYVTGKVWPCVTGHHRGDALLEVDDLQGADLYFELSSITDTVRKKFVTMY